MTEHTWTEGKGLKRYVFDLDNTLCDTQKKPDGNLGS